MQLDIDRDTLDFIIVKSREFHAKEAVTIPEEPLSPSDDWARQVLADHVDDPSYQEIKSTIENLGPAKQTKLVTLMWIGRGDYALEEWQEALRHARDSWNDHTADYLIGTPLLPDYLEQGLEQLD